MTPSPRPIEETLDPDDWEETRRLAHRMVDETIDYLATLRRRFEGPIVADLLCYLRLYTELAMRAKGLIMMREAGFDVPVDEETKAKFEEMRYLEKSIGRTGLLALQPVLPMSQKELWQLSMLGK
mgnify:CR=1 FL=1